MIKRRNLRNSDQVKVTFVLAEDQPYGKVSVVGDFNDWDPQANPLRKRSNQTYSAAVTLEKGKRYLYRYQGADGTWFNADDADAYESNEFGEQNGVLLT